ncbi:MAG: hypothetical protein A2284_05200 [Deltaproteobacteria bacterium RIFOXYA12_FULL_61_11]|nr:MAG: hypothetical protein A2284_05200 [Deltaproteobacteria bacterium RIFOXYA12_FULL_61_11]
MTVTGLHFYPYDLNINTLSARTLDRSEIQTMNASGIPFVAPPLNRNRDFSLDREDLKDPTIRFSEYRSFPYYHFK